jgi:lysophospholipase L1-like esterase
MVSCARETGATVLDLYGETGDPSWYFGDKVHFSPKGIAWLAGRLAPAVAQFLTVQGTIKGK